MNSCCISISNEQDKFPINEAELENIACEMLKRAVNDLKLKDISELRDYDLTDISLSMGILICDDERIKEFNRDYREIDKPTDVLSFALFADNPDMRIVVDNDISLGDIIISLETAQRQASENDKTLKEEVNFLLSHGILHLLGFDHPDDESLEFMLKAQDKLVAGL